MPPVDARQRTAPHGDKLKPRLDGVDCIDCGGDAGEVCPVSERRCGHHCNHSWSHERCCWCGKEWGEE